MVFPLASTISLTTGNAISRQNDMTPLTELPEVSKVLDAVEAGLSDENRALLDSNLTRRAFVLGVAGTLMQFYSDPESRQVLGKYMLETLVQTMFRADPFEATRSGQAFRALDNSVHEALTRQSPAKVDDCCRALDAILKERLQFFAEAVRVSQSILAEISTLIQDRGVGTSDSESAERVAGLLEPLRKFTARMELSEKI